MISTQCKICKKIFEAKERGRVYCGMACRDISRKENSLIELTCCTCGVVFKRKKSRPIHRKNYCSKKCSGPANHPKGVLCSADTKNKIRNSAIARGFGKWMKGRNGNRGSFKKGQFAGDKHVNWKGGITPINKQIRHSEEYLNWRKSVFERDNYTCVLCKERGGDIQADHIKPFSLFPELRFTIDNGRTLCKKCHKDITAEQMKLIWKNQFSSAISAQKPGA